MSCDRCGGSGQITVPPGPNSHAGRVDRCLNCNSEGQELERLRLRVMELETRAQTLETRLRLAYADASREARVRATLMELRGVPNETGDLLAAAMWVDECWGASQEQYCREDMEGAMAALRNALAALEPKQCEACGR